MKNDTKNNTATAQTTTRNQEVQFPKGPFTIREFQELNGLVYPTARNRVKGFLEMNMIKEVPGNDKRTQVFQTTGQMPANGTPTTGKRKYTRRNKNNKPAPEENLSYSERLARLESEKAQIEAKMESERQNIVTGLMKEREEAFNRALAIDEQLGETFVRETIMNKYHLEAITNPPGKKSPAPASKPAAKKDEPKSEKSETPVASTAKKGDEPF